MKKNTLCFVSLILFALVATPVLANQPTHDDLKRIEQQLLQERQAHLESQRQSDKLADEIRSVQKQMVRSAQAVQEKEDMILKLEERLETLRLEEAALSEKLAKSKGQTVRLVTALQSLALRPKEQFFLEKQAPAQILRSKLMLNSSVPIVREMTSSVINDMDKLEETKVEIQSQIRKIKETMSKLADRTTQMTGLIAKKTKLQAQYDETHEKSGKRIVALASQANDLKELLLKLEKEKKRRAEEEKRKKERQAKSIQNKINAFLPLSSSFEKAKGTLPYPVNGQIIENFGDATVKGMHAKGLTIQTRQEATLRAPFKGAVLFAGPFKSYGKMLIIDCLDGYLILLAGLDEIYTQTGQDVIVGEPVGKMGADRLKLYIEIRKDGQAIDPKPWFRN